MPIRYDDPISTLELSTQAPKTLAEAGITTLGQLLDYRRELIAGLPGMGASRLTDIERALEERGLAFGKPLLDLGKYRVCTACPSCPDCGMPRATETRQVVVDLRGRYKHQNAPGEPCDDCDKHHRALFATATTTA